MAQSFAFAAFKKAGKFYFLQSSQNIRERGNQLFRRVVFPSPYLFTRNFAVSHLLLKMRCIFFTEQSYTDQGSTPGPPYAVPSLFEIGILITEFSESWIRWLWLTAFGKVGLFRCQSALWPPRALLSLFDTGVLISEFSVS